MSAAYGKSFLELKLLALAQAAEAYHRRVYEGQDRYMAPAEYEKDVLPQLQAAIPATLQQSHRQALSNHVKFGNEFSFRRRLTAFFEEHEVALAVVVPSPGDWIARIVDYRNSLTHHPVASNPPGVDRPALVRCNYVLRILLELCFLKSMSIGSSEILALASRSSRYGQIRERFFR